MLDLLVIGAGLSGLTAAYTAARAGHTVKVIAKGWGALHWSAGTIDVLGYMPEDQKQPVRRPLAHMPALAASQPQHPYALSGAERLAQALDAFVALANDIGLPYGGAGNPGENLLLPSPMGAARPAYLAPRAQLAGDLNRPEPVLIAGFQGLRDFYPQLIAENLNKLGYQARAASLPFQLLSHRRDFSIVHLANEIENEERRANLGRELKKIARPGERIGLPALLGMGEHAAVMAELERQTGTAVFEIPMMPPSVPGIRLFQALRRRLQAMAVRVEAGMEVSGGQVVAMSNGADGVQWVESQTSARPMKHRARNFLLATGGILGGGFNSDHSGRVWEVIFDLPLTGPQQRSGWFHSSFLSPEGHPVFRGGVRVNQAFQPVDEGGRVLYENLWAAGNLLAGADSIQERSMEGVAIATGMAAAEAVSGQRSAISPLIADR